MFFLCIVFLLSWYQITYKEEEEELKDGKPVNNKVTQEEKQKRVRALLERERQKEREGRLPHFSYVSGVNFFVLGENVFCEADTCNYRDLYLIISLSVVIAAIRLELGLATSKSSPNLHKRAGSLGVPFVPSIETMKAEDSQSRERSYSADINDQDIEIRQRKKVEMS